MLLRKTRVIVFFLIALIIFAPFYRCYYTDNEIIALYGYLSCFDAIAIGCIAALVEQKITLSRKTAKILLKSASFFMLGIYLYSGIMDNIIVGFSFMALAAALFLIAASNELPAKPVPGFFGRIICWFGRNSYELYLFHIVVLALMKGIIKPENLNNYTKLIWAAFFIGASVLVAGIVSSFFSQPLNRKLRELLLCYRWPSVVCSRPQKIPEKAKIY